MRARRGWCQSLCQADVNDERAHASVSLTERGTAESRPSSRLRAIHTGLSEVLAVHVEDGRGSDDGHEYQNSVRPGLQWCSRAQADRRASSSASICQAPGPSHASASTAPLRKRWDSASAADTGFALIRRIALSVRAST